MWRGSPRDETIKEELFSNLTMTMASPPQVRWCPEALHRPRMLGVSEMDGMSIRNAVLGDHRFLKMYSNEIH